MDTTTLLEPIAQFTNGDILNMSEEEWKSQIDYIRVLIELLKGDSNTYRLSRSADNSVMNEKTAEKMVDIAIKKANLRTGNSFATMFALNYVGSDDYIELTDEQTDELVEGLLDGSIIKSSLPQESIDELMELNQALDNIKDLIDSKNIEDFIKEYKELLEYYENMYDRMNDNLKKLYEIILSYATLDNLEAFAESLQYLATSEAGFDLYEITQNDDGTVDINAVTTNGFGDRYNHGLRIFAKTTDYLVVGTANPFYGTQLWRRANTVIPPESSESSQESSQESSEESRIEPSESSQESSKESPSESSRESKSESSEESSTTPVEPSNTTSSNSSNESNQGKNNTVSTGDNSNIAIIATLIAVSATALIIVTKKAKNSKTK